MYGLAFGLDNEIVQLSNYSKGWHEMFNELGVDPIYRTTENFEQYWLLKIYGL